MAVWIQVLPTQLIPDEKEGKVLRVRMIQKEGVKLYDPAYLFDEGSTISWIPCGRKLTCSFPGIKFQYGPDTYFGEEVCIPQTDCLCHESGCITYAPLRQKFSTLLRTVEGFSSRYKEMVRWCMHRHLNVIH